MPLPSFHDAHGGTRALLDYSEQAALDQLDVATVVGRQAPRQLAALHAAIEADLGGEWRGGIYVVQDGAPDTTARSERAALESHHFFARRTILALPRRVGPTGALDLALDEATGKYLALVDAHTRPLPGTLGTLVDELRERPGALWAATPVPGCAVVRRRAFLAIGGFDPALRDGEALRDAAARAQAAGHELLTVADARAERDATPHVSRRVRLPRTARRPWSAAALKAWLPRARRAATRIDLP